MRKVNVLVGYFYLGNVIVVVVFFFNFGCGINIFVGIRVKGWVGEVFWI